MTKMFGNLTQDGLEETQDRLGGANLFDTGFYGGIIKVAYVGKASASDSRSVTVIVDVKGQEFKETIWITTKSGDNFYPDKQDKTKKHELPGFTTINDLCLLSTGMDLASQDTEEKVVSIYNFEQKKDIPTNVPVFPELMGKAIGLGIVRETVDKQKKDSSGNYANTGETRDQNSIDKVFHAESGRTVAEFKAQLETPVFKAKWVEKNAGVTRNRSKGAEGNSGVPGGAKGFGSPGAASGKATKSLFG